MGNASSYRRAQEAEEPDFTDEDERPRGFRFRLFRSRACQVKAPWWKERGSCAATTRVSSIVPEEDPLFDDAAVGHSSRVVRADVRRDFLLKSKVLGTGISGAVCLAEHRVTKKQVAIKSFRTGSLHNQARQMLEDEVKVYLRLDHPNVCRLLHIYEKGNQVWLVMELCRCEMYDRLKQLNRYSERETADAMVQMLRAVNYLHSHNIVHRDLKLENWMYADTETNNTIKLIDFGFSRILKNSSEELHLACGTLPYLSPERLRQRYTSKSDVWSLGVICYELLLARSPFAAKSDKGIVKHILHDDYPRSQRWSHLSDGAKYFIDSLLCKDPDFRPDAATALQHPWLRRLTNVGREAPQHVLEALSDFRRLARGTQLQRATLNLIAHRLTSEEREGLESVFLAVDTEGRGTISFNQLSSVLRKACPGITENELNCIFTWLDVFHEEEIHYTPFLAALLPTCAHRFEQKVTDAFRAFDLENTGYITAEGLQQAFKGTTCPTVPLRSTFIHMQETCTHKSGGSLSASDARTWVAEVDYKGNGSIDFEGFLAAIQGKTRLTVSLEELSKEGPSVRVFDAPNGPWDPECARSVQCWSDDEQDNWSGDSRDKDRSKSLCVHLDTKAPVLRVRTSTCQMDEEYFSEMCI